MLQSSRTYLLLVMFIGLKAFGNLSLAIGTKHLPETLSANPLPYLRAMLDPYVVAGIVMLIVGQVVVRMALLSLADLSFVLPTTAIGYVLAAALGRIFLKEAVSPYGWLAVSLIFAGAALAGSTPRSTTPAAEKSK